MRNSCTSVFPNTCAWEQQELNKAEREDDKKRCVRMERSKAGTKKSSPKGLNYSSGLSSPGVATPGNSR